jgi:hypothetical protein
VLGAAALAVAGAEPVCLAQPVVMSVTPTADAFVRSLAPESNYGAAGSLSVSGATAVNGSSQQNGLFDSLLRFPMASVAAAFNNAFASNGWVVTSAALNAKEVAAPNNPIFNRGIGAFEIRWIASDNWVEGAGTPDMPTSDGVTYDDLGTLLNPGMAALGQFTNSGMSGPVSFPLALAPPLVSNIVAGKDLNLYLTAASATVGFTFNSRNYPSTDSWPSLQITAVARPLPRISTIELIGGSRVVIRFNTVSNWAHTLQGTDGLVASGAAWSNLFTVPAKPVDGQAEFEDMATNRQKFYRLFLSR